MHEKFVAIEMETTYYWHVPFLFIDRSVAMPNPVILS